MPGTRRRRVSVSVSMPHRSRVSVRDLDSQEERTMVISQHLSEDRGDRRLQPGRAEPACGCELPARLHAQYRPRGRDDPAVGGERPARRCTRVPRIPRPRLPGSEARQARRGRRQRADLHPPRAERRDLRAILASACTSTCFNADAMPHSFHVHGLRYGADSDGSWPFGTQATDGRRSDEICPGQTWTYRFEITR